MGSAATAITISYAYVLEMIPKWDFFHQKVMIYDYLDDNLKSYLLLKYSAKRENWRRNGNFQMYERYRIIHEI